MIQYYICMCIYIYKMLNDDVEYIVCARIGFTVVVFLFALL